jgi:hypothetical protein
MKIPLFLLLMNLATVVCAEADADRERAKPGEEVKIDQDPLTVRALGNLEKKMGIQFTIPFPASFDTDAYRKRPLALLPLDGKKVLATRPIANPYDEPRAVEWTMGPEDPAKLAKDGVDCSMELDERGDFNGTNLMVDWAWDGKSTPQLRRGEDETGAVFFERARLTYRLRATKAKDPALAELLLAGFEKLATTIQALRKEESRTGAK